MTQATTYFLPKAEASGAMTKKTLFFAALAFILLSTLYLPSTFAQASLQWDLPEGARMRLGKGGVNEIRYSPDGTRLAVAYSIGVWIYDAQIFEAPDLLKGHTSEVLNVAFSPNGKSLATGSSNDLVYLWDVPTGDHLYTIAGIRM